MKNIIVVLNYNDYDTTKKFVLNCKNLVDYDKIIVVDNCSSDSSYEKLLELASDKIDVIQNNKNNGYGGGNNFAIKHILSLGITKAQLIISNPDIEFTGNQFNKIFEYLNNGSNCLVAPTIKEKNRVIRGWKLPSCFSETLGNIPKVGQVFLKMNLYSNSKYNSDVTYVDAVSGSCLGIDLETFCEIGMYDENVFLYYEENILASRLKEHGYKSLILNDVEVFHNHSVSINKSVNENKKVEILKQSQYYYFSNYGNTSKISLFFLRLSINVLLKLRSTLISGRYNEE